jgi:cobalamin biosynthesis protein CobD/CbiB
MDAIANYSFENRLFLLVIASYAALLIGLSGTLFHFLLLDSPARGWRAVLNTLETRLNRPHRPVRDRILRGRLLLLILCSIVVFIGVCVILLTSFTAFGWIIEITFLTYLLPVSRILLPIRQGLALLKSRKIKQLPALIQPLTDVDTHDADGFHLIRIMVTYSINAFPRYIVTPTFWYLLLGLPALFVCRLMTVLTDMFPSTIGKNRSFVTAFHFWDKAMQLVPVRIGVFFLWCAMIFVPKAHPLRALRAFTHIQTDAPLTTRTLCTRLCAYALHYSLAGPYTVQGEKRADKWIGSGKARLDSTDLARVLWWYWCSIGLWLTTLTGIYLM